MVINYASKTKLFSTSANTNIFSMAKKDTPSKETINTKKN